MDAEIEKLNERITEVRKHIAILSLELSDLERKKAYKESNSNTHGKQLLQG